MEMRCFCKLLGISYRDHITNEEVKARIGNAIGPYEDLLTSVKRRKLKWYRHVTRSSGLAKTILQGTVQGGRRRGRQRKRWEDNIKEWTGLEWNIILQKAENREEWRKLVVKSTVVPQRSARLRDRSDQIRYNTEPAICGKGFSFTTQLAVVGAKKSFRKGGNTASPHIASASWDIAQRAIANSCFVGVGVGT